MCVVKCMNIVNDNDNIDNTNNQHIKFSSVYDICFCLLLFPWLQSNRSNRQRVLNQEIKSFISCFMALFLLHNTTSSSLRALTGVTVTGDEHLRRNR